MNTIPDWMQKNEEYAPGADREGFISKSLLSVMSVLSKFRRAGIGRGSAAFAPSAPMKLVMAIVMIVLASCSGNMFFTYCLLAVLLVHMCTLKEHNLLTVFTSSIAAAALSALILLPAVFLGSPHTMLTVSLKVFLSVGLLGIMAATTSWNRITEGLRFFRVPDLLIFTFDITLKYIVILGDICLDMLNALKLRSVGRNREKKNAISGIIGTAFIKSRSMSDEMCGAMACRGFEGEYRKGNTNLISKYDALYALFTAAVIGLFIYL